MKINIQKQFILSLALFLVAYGLLLLCWINAFPHVKPRGSLAVELNEYYTSVVPLYDVETRKTFFMLIVAFVGIFSVALKLFRNKRIRSSDSKYRQFSLLSLLGISGIIIAYIVMGPHYSFSCCALEIGIISLYFISFWSPTRATALKITQPLSFPRRRESIVTYSSNIQYNLFGKAAIVILYCIAGAALIFLVSHTLKHFMFVAAPSSMDFVLNVGVHFSALLSNSMRLADGYAWGSGVKPTYGLLLPEIASHVLAFSSFSISSWLHLLQSLQIVLISCFLLAAGLSSRHPITLLYVCIALLLYDPASVLLYFPNHGGWRYLGVALVMLALSIAVFQNKRLSLLSKILFATLAFLINFETGIILSLGFCASELFSRHHGWFRVIKYSLFTAIFTAFSLLLLLHRFSQEVLSPIFPILGKLHNSSFGGEMYVVIPAFAAVFIHASIVLWRTANSGIKNAYQELGVVCAVYCLLWSMYYIDRPNVIYFSSIALVYAFLANRLYADVRWLMGSQQKLSILLFFPLAFA